MAIYVDANLLRGRPTGLEFATLRAVAKAHKLDLLVPSIAFEEAMASRIREAETAVLTIESALNKGSWVVRVPFTRPDIANLAAEWREEFTGKVQILPVTAKQAEEALGREISRTAPTRDGHGARDAAIWLAIRDDHISRSEPGYLLSANSRDFGDRDRGQLRVELAAEVARQNHRLGYVRSAQELMEGLGTHGGTSIGADQIARSEEASNLVRTEFSERAPLLTLNELYTTYGSIPRLGNTIAVTVAHEQLAGIQDQATYKLADGSEVAVLLTRWTATLHYTVSGVGDDDTDPIAAGRFDMAATVQFWVSRDTPNAPLTFEISDVGVIDVSG